jgi:hypothetical protein
MSEVQIFILEKIHDKSALAAWRFDDWNYVMMYVKGSNVWFQEIKYTVRDDGDVLQQYPMPLTVGVEWAREVWANYINDGYSRIPWVRSRTRRDGHMSDYKGFDLNDLVDKDLEQINSSI